MDGKRASDWLDLARSREVGDLVGARDKECFRNSAMGLYSMPEPDARYVEGWAITDMPIVFAHGWIELGDGTVVDPTPVWREKNGDAEATYFGGRFYDRREVSEKVTELGHTPFDDRLAMGLVPPDLTDVYRAANVALYGEEAAAFLLDDPTPTTEEAV